MERIWNEKRLAFPLHLARWKVELYGQGLWFWGFWLDRLKLVAVRGKKLNTIIKKYKI